MSQANPWTSAKSLQTREKLRNNNFFFNLDLTQQVDSVPFRRGMTSSPTQSSYWARTFLLKLSLQLIQLAETY